MASMTPRSLALSLSLLLACSAVHGGELRASADDDGSQAVLDAIDAAHERTAGLARRLWSLAEVGYLEVQSSALLAGELEHAGFSVERGVAGMPTAFVA